MTNWHALAVEMTSHHRALSWGARAVYPLYRAARTRWRARPALRWINLEATNACDLACTMCPSRLSTRPRGFMSTQVLDAAVEQIPEASLERISVLSLGEPTLHPHLDAVIARAASRRPADLFLSTNGLSLRSDREAAARLLAAGLRHVHFSAEGYDDATYEATRVGARFEAFVSSVRQFCSVRDEVAPAAGLHLAYTVVRPHDRAEIARVLETYAALVDVVEFRIANNQSHREIELRRDEEILGVRCFDRRPSPCIALWCGMTVLWDGTISLCPRDHELRFVVGSVDGPLSDAWHGLAARTLRADHAAGRFPEPCRSCSELYATPLAQLELDRRVAMIAREQAAAGRPTPPGQCRPAAVTPVPPAEHLHTGAVDER